MENYTTIQPINQIKFMKKLHIEVGWKKKNRKNSKLHQMTCKRNVSAGFSAGRAVKYRKSLSAYEEYRFAMTYSWREDIAKSNDPNVIDARMRWVSLVL